MKIHSHYEMRIQTENDCYINQYYYVEGNKMLHRATVYSGLTNSSATKLLNELENYADYLEEFLPMKFVKK